MTDVLDSTTADTRETLQCQEVITDKVEEPKLVLHKLSLQISDSDVIAYFASLGVQVKSVNWLKRRTCVVEFPSLTDAETALAASRAQNLGGTKIDWARPEHTAKEPNLPKHENGTFSSVCIAKLAKDVRESELVKVLQACGQVTGIQMLQDSETNMFNGTALATYSREEEAALAVEQLRGLKLFGQPIEVTRAGGRPDSTTRYPLDSCLTQRAAVPESSAKHHVSEPPHHHGMRTVKKRLQEKSREFDEPQHKREDSPEVVIQRRSSPQPERQGSPPSSLSTEAHRSLSLKKRILQKVVEDNDMQSQSRPNSVERRGVEQLQSDESSWYYNNDSDSSSPVRSAKGERASPRRSGRDTRRKCVIPEEDESSNELEVDEFAEEREANGGDSSWEPSEDGIERPSEDKELEVLMMCQKIVDEYDRPEQSETAVYYLLDTLRNTRRTRPEVPKRCRNPLNYEDIFRKLGMIQDPKNSAHFHCWQLPPQGSTQRAFMDEIRAEGRLKKNAEKLSKAKTESVVRKELKSSSMSMKEREKRRGRKRKSQDREADGFIDKDEARERKRMSSLSNINNLSSAQPKRRGPGRPPKREKVESWGAEGEQRMSFADRRIGERKRRPKRIYPFEEEEEGDSDYISSEHESEEDRLYFKRKEARMKKIGEESEPGTLRKRARKAPSILSVLAGRDEEEDEDVEVVGDEEDDVAVVAAPKEIVKNVASIEKELGMMMEEINMKMQALQEKQNQMLLMKEKMRLLQTC